MNSLIWTAVITLILLFLMNEIYTLFRKNNPITPITTKKDMYRIMYERLLEKEKNLVDEIDYYRVRFADDLNRTFVSNPNHQNLEDVTEEVFSSLESRRTSDLNANSPEQDTDINHQAKLDATTMLRELSSFVKENDIETKLF